MEYYRCYSYPLKEWIKSHGVRYITTALDIKTQKQFWLYIKDNKFSELLQEWADNSPIK